MGPNLKQRQHLQQIFDFTVSGGHDAPRIFGSTLFGAHECCKKIFGFRVPEIFHRAFKSPGFYCGEWQDQTPTATSTTDHIVRSAFEMIPKLILPKHFLGGLWKAALEAINLS